jgi:hypothetical protein
VTLPIDDVWSTVEIVKHSDMLAPVAAALAALTTLLCCLPVGFATAAALGSLSVVVSEHQSWFMAASVVLLGVGVVQLRHAQRACARRPTSSRIVLCISAAIVVLVIFFPQLVAGIVADLLP